MTGADDYAAFLAQKRANRAPRPTYAPGVPMDTSRRFHWSLEEFDLEFEGYGPFTYIYGLFDPRTGELRYVGKTDRPRERLANQMNERSNTHRCHWLQELRSAGLMPVQRIFDAAPRGGDWQRRECAYIEAARMSGCRLTNGTDGGDGVSGLSDEARAKMRATWLGRKHSPESIRKMSEANRGRLHTPEWRQFMHDRMKDREFSDEHRAKIRRKLQKMTDDQVREIRRLLSAGTSQYVIAERYGVHQGSISNIARGITYRDVT